MSVALVMLDQSRNHLLIVKNLDYFLCPNVLIQKYQNDFNFSC